MNKMTAGLPVMDRWEAIRRHDRPLVIERRAFPFSPKILEPLLANPDFELRLDGSLEEIARQIVQLPDSLRFDMLLLAERFAELMEVDAVRLRLETIDSNACRKVHADYTDVRLICTYAGEATDYVPNPDLPEHLLRMKAGWIGLFKGRTFHPDHPPALHRSPPIEGTGACRLLLVIDTPLKGDVPVFCPGMK
ncbi:MAG: DUF1826 domain-containing protein [Sphingobium sp.]